VGERDVLSPVLVPPVFEEEGVRGSAGGGRGEAATRSRSARSRSAFFECRKSRGATRPLAVTKIWPKRELRSLIGITPRWTARNLRGDAEDGADLSRGDETLRGQGEARAITSAFASESVARSREQESRHRESSGEPNDFSHKPRADPARGYLLGFRRALDRPVSCSSWQKGSHDIGYARPS